MRYTQMRQINASLTGSELQQLLRPPRPRNFDWKAQHRKRCYEPTFQKPALGREANCPAARIADLEVAIKPCITVNNMVTQVVKLERLNWT